MRKIILFLLANITAINLAFSQGMAINSTGTKADSSAMLDISSTAKGVLVPRMTDAQKQAISSPATGLMIYQTDGTAGYYYWDGGAWTKLSTGSGSGWSTSGNTLTGSLPGSPDEFLGSTNAADLILTTNNTEKARITSGGYFGIGKSNPSSLLHINGDSPVLKIETKTNMTDPAIYLIKFGVRTMELKLSDVGPNYGLLITDQNSGIPRMVVNASSGNVGIGIGNGNPGARLDVKSDIHISGSSSGYVGLTVPASAGSTTYTLPSADGASGQVLSTNGSGTLSWTDNGGGSSSYTVGQSYGGGIIFYVTPNGQHGLIAATQDQSSSCSYQNAQDIISNPANHNTAGKEFTDWRMPSKYELNLMYLNKATIGGFAASWYWSSTIQHNPVESAYWNATAWQQNFSSGSQVFYPNYLQNTAYIRAVRSF